MHTENHSVEDFTQNLRSLSQKRKQGTLELNIADKQAHILFVAGKVVEFFYFGSNPVIELAQNLLQAGFITNSDLQGAWSQSYSQLYTNISAKIDPETFRLAIKHRVLNHLYRLNQTIINAQSFKTQMIDLDKQFSPSISIGQLLLDFVALSDDAENFNATFRSEEIILKVKDHPSLTAEEKLICTCLGSENKLEVLQTKSLLSTYHFREALISLLQKGVIAKQAKIERSAKTEEPKQTLHKNVIDHKIFSALDSSIDAAFASEATPLDLELPPASLDLEINNVTETKPASLVLEASSLSINSFEKSAQNQTKNLFQNSFLNIGQQPIILHSACLSLLIFALLLPVCFWGEIFRAFAP